MNHSIDPNVPLNEQQLQLILDQLNTLAAKHQGDSVALLAILRHLEKLHRQIRETWFQDALPNNRQALYTLLREMETEGGWPYISRMQLQGMIQTGLHTEVNPNLPQASVESDAINPHTL